MYTEIRETTENVIELCDIDDLMCCSAKKTKKTVKFIRNSCESIKF